MKPKWNLQKSIYICKSIIDMILIAEAYLKSTYRSVNNVQIYSEKRDTGYRMLSVFHRVFTKYELISIVCFSSTPLR